MELHGEVAVLKLDNETGAKVEQANRYELSVQESV